MGESANKAMLIFLTRPQMLLGVKQKRTMGDLAMRWLLLLLMTWLYSCATIPTTNVYRITKDEVSRVLYVLPVADDTPSASVSSDALRALRRDLVQSLAATGAFASVSEAETEATDKPGTTYVRCRVSQADVSARRMVFITELFDGRSSAPFVRLVTRTELVSLVWPIDYVGAMENARAKVVDDVKEHIVGLAKR